MGSYEFVCILYSPRFIPLILIPSASLNALPFGPNVFDFVRIRYIGLAVPEDKVQSFTPMVIVLTEADRILVVAGSLGGGCVYALSHFSLLHTSFIT